MTLLGVLDGLFWALESPSRIWAQKCHSAGASWHLMGPNTLGRFQGPKQASNTPRNVNPPPKNHNAPPHIINSAINSYYRPERYFMHFPHASVFLISFGFQHYWFVLWRGGGAAGGNVDRGGKVNITSRVWFGVWWGGGGP